MTPDRRGAPGVVRAGDLCRGEHSSGCASGTASWKRVRAGDLCCKEHVDDA